MPSPRPSKATFAPVVIAFAIVSADSAARLLRGLYPGATIRVDHSSNAIVVGAAPDDVNGMRTIASGIDIKSPTSASVEALLVHTESASRVVGRLAPLFPKARFAATTRNSIVVAAGAQDMMQIKSALAAIDTPSPAPTQKPAYPSQAIQVVQGDVRAIARAVARSARNVRVAVAGSAVVLTGATDDVNAAKLVVGQLDVPPPHLRYTEVYRLRAVDAGSVADLLSRSFRDASIEADKQLNAITVVASGAQQQRISDSIAALDASPAVNGQQNGQLGAAGGNADSEVVTLHAAIPAAGGAASTSASDIAQTVSQALAGDAPDLKITVHPNSTRLVLTGSQYSVDRAKRLIAELDVPEPLVELDTEVYEVDEAVQKQLGFKLPTTVLSTTYSEIVPTAGSNGVTPPLLRLQPLTRTPLTLAAALDFLISTNRARILEDPRLTTFSGRTASIRAGETVNILTTAGGGSGTVATTQIQSFQTGVTLDITPVVNADDYVTVTLHPSVNSVAGIGVSGVPNIQTRDTTTTVGLHDGETIVVGGLIEDSTSRSVQKIPFLGDLPLIGRLFQDVGVNHTRNELIVTVTPHILKPRAIRAAQSQGAESTLVAMPTPEPLPTVEPFATLPPLIERSPSRRPPGPVRTTPAPAPVASSAVGTGTQKAPGGAVAATPSASPGVSPAPFPTAFAQTNTYTFGAAPANNYADQNQPPQIFFVQVQPTVVKAGQPITISAITTTNVSTLQFGASSVSVQASLSNIGPGKWQSTFNFSTAGLPNLTGNATLVLTATTTLGANASLRIPFSIVN